MDNVQRSELIFRLNRVEQILTWLDQIDELGGRQEFEAEEKEIKEKLGMKP